MLFGGLFCVVLLARSFGADAGMTNPPRASAGNQPGVEGVVYAFFADTTGERLGGLRIARIGVESGREGFLRVAWKPRVVFEGVTVEISAAATWPSTGRQILDALRGAEREGCLLRDVHLKIDGANPRELRAASGRLRPDGALELSVAAPPGARGPEARPVAMCYWLAGPLAGQLLPAAPPPAGSRASRPNVPAIQQRLD